MATNTRAPLHERLNALALAFQEKAWEKADEVNECIDGSDADELRQFLRDHAYSLSEFARQCEEDYAPLSTDGEVPTNAQGIALARFLRSRFTDRTAAAAITRGTHGLPDDYLHVTFLGTTYEGGIDREGRVSA